VNVLVELAKAAPLALLSALPVALIGGLVVHRMRRRSMTATLTALVLVPLLAALIGVVATSGFMYTPQLVGTIVVVGVVAVVTVPAAMLLGRSVARETLWQREAREAERQAEAARRELVAGIGHDLRSPLAGIRGMTDALLDGVVHQPGEVDEYLRRIRRESVRMAGMVEDLFQLSRATSAALRLPSERLALGEVASDAAAAETTAAAAAGVTITAAGPTGWPTVLGSDADLVRVLRNLLSNAIRHTPAGETVWISAGTRGAEAWLAVQDGCGGIPEGDLDRVFDPGYRGTDARTPDECSGAGLGLAIAKALMEAQQGRITVTNEPPGCRFEITLPLADDQATHPDPAHAPPPRSRAPSTGGAHRKRERSPNRGA
jgi:signal transduction histidine kinase